MFDQHALLENETVFPMVCLARLRLELNLANSAANNMRMRELVNRLSKDAMLIMGRATEKKARIEYHDVKLNQSEYQVLAPPIDTTEDIIVVHNTDQPRDFTDTDDVVSSNYIVCDPKRAAKGAILIEYSLSRADEALKISYTGGMASFAGVVGVDGAMTGGAATLTSAGSTFITDGVAAGYKVKIIGGTNAGTYTVHAVTSETVLTMTGNFTNTLTGQEFKVLDADSKSLIEDYPELASAVLSQAAFVWRRQMSTGIQTESISGASVSFDGPVRWLPANLDILNRLARKPI